MDWRPLPYGTDLVRLYVSQIEVARLCSRLDGTWYVMLDQHLHYDLRTQTERLEQEVREQWAKTRDRV